MVPTWTYFFGDFVSGGHVLYTESDLLKGPADLAAACSRLPPGSRAAVLTILAPGGDGENVGTGRRRKGGCVLQR